MSKRYVSFISPCPATLRVRYSGVVSYLHKDINMLERTRQFVSKMCTKIWDSSYMYHELLETLHLPTLAQCRLHLSLCLMYRTIHGYFPPNNINIVPSGTSSHYTTLCRSYSLHQPFARTDSSFLPNTVLHWNSLPEYVVTSPSLSSFKHDLSLSTSQFGYAVY